MKPEYQQRAIENLNAIDKRADIIQQMMEGSRPANPAEALRLVKEIKRLVELTNNLVDLS